MGNLTQTASAGSSKSDLCPELITLSNGAPWKRRTRLEKVLVVISVVLFIAANDGGMSLPAGTPHQTDVVTSTVPKRGTTNTVQKTDSSTVQHSYTAQQRGSGTRRNARADQGTCYTSDCQEAAREISESIDPNVEPCDDFYKFACGNWIRSHPIPADRSSINRFSENSKVLRRNLHALLTVNDSSALEAFRKARTYFRACMDTGSMDANGINPLKDLLDGFKRIPTLNPKWVNKGWNLNDFLTQVGLIGGLGDSILIQFVVIPDLKQPNKSIIFFTEPSLHLPRQDYLGPRNSTELMLYQQLYVDLMVALGASRDTASQDAKDVVDFEILLANASLPTMESQNIEGRYHKVTVSNLTQMFPQFNWLGFLQERFSLVGITVTSEEEVIEYSLHYHNNFFSMELPPRTVWNYGMWKLYVLPGVDFLSGNLRRIKNMYNRKRTGRSEGRERWAICTDTTNNKFPNTVGRMYVDKHFSPKAKTRIDNMILNLTHVFQKMLLGVRWMTVYTRSEALGKLNAVIKLIGYPEAIKNDSMLNAKYQNLSLSDGKYFENVINFTRFVWHQKLRSLRQPYDKTEWVMSAATVNAFYSSLSNSINFPAAILTKPFYSEQFTDALNFGGIGHIIGHELIHGFDNIGAMFDKDGRYRDWWRTEDWERFNERSQCMIDQYSRFVDPVTNLAVNGNVTLGENIADNGGIKIAYRAYQFLIKNKKKEKQKLPGLNYTSEQLFFIRVAQVWCSNATEKARRIWQKSDNHSPYRFRVIGPLQNIRMFSKAFNCPVGSNMNPRKLCHVW